MTKPDETVSLYVNQFQHRLPMFDRMHQEEMRAVKHDAVSQLFSDYRVFGDKSSYDALLRGMLSDEEMSRLNAALSPENVAGPRYTEKQMATVDR